MIRLKNRIYQLFYPSFLKHKSELAYWSKIKSEEGILTNSHYQYYFTVHFSLSLEYYRGKRVLDIGCGPRGSLEWADMALERIGLDPLANKYKKLGTASHKMTYIPGSSASIPFSDGYFDIVTSFNSLDHVANLDKSIAEIVRVVKPGGLFLLLSELDHPPTSCEPISFSWDIVDRFSPYFHILEERHFERQGRGIYESIQMGVLYNHENPTYRYGIISAKFQRNKHQDSKSKLYKI
jgi:ubiquinone/menaquinone biosynthesis C-methylase UbiE